MNINELFHGVFRGVTPISVSAMRPGDRVAYQPTGQPTICIADVDHFDHLGRPAAATGSLIGDPSQDFYLIHRPKLALPDQPGDMIRIHDWGTTPAPRPAGYETGIVLTKTRDRWVGIGNQRLLSFTVHDFTNYGITWERVYYTSQAPDIVDAAVLDDEPDEMPQATLPLGPGILIELKSGKYEGALLRHHSEPMSPWFFGVLPDGNTLQVTKAFVEESGWEAVTTTRDSDYYKLPPF